MDQKDWNLLMNVHLTGTYKCCKAVWPLFMAQRHGKIVNVCSAAGLHGNYGQANYSAGIILKDCIVYHIN